MTELSKEMRELCQGLAANSPRMTLARLRSIINKDGRTLAADLGDFDEEDHGDEEQINIVEDALRGEIDELVLRHGEKSTLTSLLIPEANLKLVLKNLGDRLVLEHGFDPAYSGEPRSTTVLDAFARWLNCTPEAREVLGELGFQWPVVEDRLTPA